MPDFRCVGVYYFSTSPDSRNYGQGHGNGYDNGNGFGGWFGLRHNSHNGGYAGGDGTGFGDYSGFEFGHGGGFHTCQTNLLCKGL